MPADVEVQPPAKRARPENAADGADAAAGVPVVDISPFLAAFSGRADASSGDARPKTSFSEEALGVARRWKEAFATYGFAQVVGHGVPDGVIEATYAAASRFFALPEEEKKNSDLGKGYGAGGFTAQGGERVSATASKPDGSSLLGAVRARPPDRVESMVIHRKPGEAMPSAVPGFREAVYTYHDEMTRLLRVIMCLTACALDLPEGHFDSDFFGDGGVGPEKCVGECSLRLAYYPPAGDENQREGNRMRYGEHTDYTGFTILWQDQNADGPQTNAANARPPVGGLQVKMPDGHWADCPPVPGAFTVNAGDLIQVWTNDVLLSNLHRVANPPPGDKDKRISLVFFTGPRPDTVVECLPTCMGPDRPARYSPVTAGQHLKRKLQASNE